MAATDQQMAATARELHAALLSAEKTVVARELHAVLLSAEKTVVARELHAALLSAEKAARKAEAEARALWCRCDENGPCCRECDPEGYFY